MTKSKQQKNAILTIVCLLALAVFGAAMVWLHYQQLCSPGGGDDPYTSDLGQHLYFAQQGMIYSTVSLLIGPAYNVAGHIGIAVLLAVFHLAAVAVFAWGLRAALPESTRPVRLLVSLAVNLATAVWMPRGGYWYQGTVGGTIYHNTTYIMLAPFALLTMLAFYRVWPTVCGRLDLRSYAVYTVLLTVATSFKANLIFAFAPALLVLLIADFVRSRAKNLKNEILMGCSVFPGVALCFVQARVLFAAEDSGIRLIFTVPFDHHRMLWGPFNEAGVLGLARSFVRRGKAFATGSACSPLRSRWPRPCCWSRAASGSTTPISGGGRSSASGHSGWNRSAFSLRSAVPKHRGGGWSSAGWRWSGIWQAASASLSCCCAACPTMCRS